MNLDDLERMVGIQRTAPRARTRAEIDKARKKKLSRPWRGVRAKRKRT